MITITTPVTTPLATPVEDTTSHVTSDSSYQQSWYSDGSGQISSHDPPNQLIMETNNIMTFHMELSADMYQHWNASLRDCPHADSVLPSMLQVPLINPVQESCGQSDASNTYKTVLVSDSDKEYFVISPSV